MYLIELPKGVDNRYYGAHFIKRLGIGHLYEDLVVTELRLLGLEAYRPNQDKLPKSGRMTAKHQTDVFIKLDKVRRLPIEVKSRASPFKFQSVLVGGCDSWDLKRRETSAVIVVCQNSGQTAVAPGNKEEWTRMRVRNYALSYSIPSHLFTPLDIWADAIREGLYS